MEKKLFLIVNLSDGNASVSELFADKNDIIKEWEHYGHRYTKDKIVFMGQFSIVESDILTVLYINSVATIFEEEITIPAGYTEAEHYIYDSQFQIHKMIVKIEGRDK